MTDYFNYDVEYAMNITDIDDKVSVPVVAHLVQLICADRCGLLLIYLCSYDV